MVAYTEDKMVKPWQTQWFMEYTKNGKLIPFRKGKFYTENLIGLKTLDEAGKVARVWVKGGHLRGHYMTNRTILDFLRNGNSFGKRVTTFGY